MAGMPQRVLSRAEEVLKWLEKSHETPVGARHASPRSAEVVPHAGADLQSVPQHSLANRCHNMTEIRHGTDYKSAPADYQLSFIQLDDPLLEEIKNDILNTNIDTLTPVEALMKLHSIKGLLQRKV